MGCNTSKESIHPTEENKTSNESQKKEEEAKRVEENNVKEKHVEKENQSGIYINDQKRFFSFNLTLFVY